MNDEQLVLPTVQCVHLPDSNRMGVTVYSNDEIVYSFWFHEGVLVDASLKTYGRDSITVQILGGSRKVGTYGRVSK